MEIKWTPALNIGHDVIDSQHVEIFSLFDQFVEGCAHGRGKQSLLELHKKLQEYVKTHFRDEEALMTSTGYPGLDKQKREHQKFNRELQEIGKSIARQGATLMDLIQANKLLVNWLVNHVQDVDQEFGKFLHARDGSS